MRGCLDPERRVSHRETSTTRNARHPPTASLVDVALSERRSARVVQDTGERIIENVYLSATGSSWAGMISKFIGQTTTVDYRNNLTSFDA